MPIRRYAAIAVMFSIALGSMRLGAAHEPSRAPAGHALSAAWVTSPLEAAIWTASFAVAHPPKGRGPAPHRPPRPPMPPLPARRTALTSAAATKRSPAFYARRPIAGPPIARPWVDEHKMRLTAGRAMERFLRAHNVVSFAVPGGPNAFQLDDPS